MTSGRPWRRMLPRRGLIAVCGGDGSINAAAAIALERETPLARDPGRDLQPPRARSRASTIARKRSPRSRRVSGLRSMWQRSTGRYSSTRRASGAMSSWSMPGEAREEDREVAGPAGRSLQVLRSSEPVDVELDGQPRTDLDGVHRQLPLPPERFRSLVEGRSGGRVARHPLRGRITTLGRAIRLLLSVLTGRLGRSRVYVQTDAVSLRVRSRNGRPRLARDGETFEASSEEFVIVKDLRQLVRRGAEGRSGALQVAREHHDRCDQGRPPRPA